ncbi:unnamed protein product [Amoebophrya sp. A25]|nr:unnamed protein product [Amoebophrya sp. A25]|eukprot:GSA25T00000332001.1
MQNLHPYSFEVSTPGENPDEGSSQTSRSFGSPAGVYSIVSSLEAFLTTGDLSLTGKVILENGKADFVDLSTIARSVSRQRSGSVVMIKPESGLTLVPWKAKKASQVTQQPISRCASRTSGMHIPLGFGYVEQLAHLCAANNRPGGDLHAGDTSENLQIEEEQGDGSSVDAAEDHGLSIGDQQNYEATPRRLDYVFQSRRYGSRRWYGIRISPDKQMGALVVLNQTSHELLDTKITAPAAGRAGEVSFIEKDNQDNDMTREKLSVAVERKSVLENKSYVELKALDSDSEDPDLLSSHNSAKTCCSSHERLCTTSRHKAPCKRPKDRVSWRFVSQLAFESYDINQDSSNFTTPISLSQAAMDYNATAAALLETQNETRTIHSKVYKRTIVFDPIGSYLLLSTDVYEGIRHKVMNSVKFTAFGIGGR